MSRKRGQINENRRTSSLHSTYDSECFFLELLKEKPVAKITVKEICEHAEINRSTFYKHYRDVYDLMEKLENEAVEAFEKLLDSYVQNETVPALVTLLTSLRENRELLLPLLANSSNDDFMKRLTDACSGYALSHPHRRRTIRVIQNRRPSMLILQEEHRGIISNWLETGTQEPPQQVAELIQSLNETVLTVLVPQVFQFPSTMQSHLESSHGKVWSCSQDLFLL